MVEVPEPRVIDEPGARVWLAIMYWDFAFGVMVWPLTVIGAKALARGVAKLWGEVVRIFEPSGTRTAGANSTGVTSEGTAGLMSPCVENGIAAKG